ncbi:MAG: hypothetical protein A3C81_00245 [Candidatus Yanofskybacteria bacterium RIFCSPHIGHO2_02_FULL_46_19]|uniref:Bacterial sugar transferase domain-containing protein n=3 Tax=Candidatus Yanofskyibacteriota TaxID=1752733 RepID=A0A1F8FS72_9BACT|nr:MAG: hypothetical protein A3C81_00245 [Candidatus Yanofskybacteria bacterium RIFCSPHIGHO2_02_FULL_46_19]OGN27258.1 MAG: hypothetical protein A3B17_00655 [Candidatus Yanofskybacteria bacterium RIFCSPLOWO2_01_FULL_45_72]
MKVSPSFFTVIKLPLDFLMLFSAGIVTYLLRTKIISSFRPVLFDLDLPLGSYLYIILFVSVLFLAAYAISGLYSFKGRLSAAEEFLKIAVASSAGVMLLIIYIFLRQELFNSRFLVLGGWFLSVIFVFWGRRLLYIIQKYLVSRKDFGVRRTVVIGDGRNASKVIEDINRNPASGYRLAAHLRQVDLEFVARLIENGGLDKVILADTDYPMEKVTDLIGLCHENFITFKYVPDMHQTLTVNFGIDIFNGLPMIELKRTRLDGWGKIFKRTLDIAAAIIGLIIFSPLFLVLAVIIKLDSNGPVFARLKRVSCNKEFILYKFRSMIKNAEEFKPQLAVFNERQDGPLFKMRDDPRITGVGRFIRRTRIDELPQFWNVLKGDIALVGPRPHQPDEIARYQKHHRKLLAIKAGATGLAQVSGSSDLPFEQEVSLDSFYIDSWSLWLDIKIILKTVFKMLNDRSAV